MADKPEPVPWTALTELRHDAGLNLTQLAVESGMSVPYLCQIEGGHRNGTPGKLKPIADALSRRLGRSITVTDLERTRPKIVRSVA